MSPGLKGDKMGEHKIINLDDAAKTVEIKLGGEAFNISRITLEMRQLYGEYLTFCGEYYQRVLAFNVQAENESKLEKLNEIDADQNKAIEEFARGKAERIEAMLKLLLEKNGYKYSRKWWESNADYTTMETFIVEAINKDTESASKKKEAAS